MTGTTTQVVDSAKDCRWPACKTADGGCSDNYPCTAQNDRVSREIEDPTIVPVAA